MFEFTRGILEHLLEYSQKAAKIGYSTYSRSRSQKGKLEALLYGCNLAQDYFVNSRSCDSREVIKLCELGTICTLSMLIQFRNDVECKDKLIVRLFYKMSSNICDLRI